MESDFGNYFLFMGKKIFLSLLITLIAIFCGGLFFHIITLSSHYNEFFIIGAFLLLAAFAIYFFYVLASPEALLPFIICSSCLVFIEPAPTDILGALAILSLFIRVLIRRRKFRRINFMQSLFFFFLLLNINNVINAQNDIESRLLFLFITGYLIALAFFVFHLSSSYDSIRKQLALFLIPAVITSLALILTYLATSSQMGLGGFQNLLMTEERSRAFFKDPNVAGPFLILPGTYCFALLLNERRTVKYLFLCLFLLIGIAIFSTLSRGAIMGFFISMLAVSILSVDKKTSYRIIMGLSLVIGVLVLLVCILPKNDIFDRIYDRNFGVDDRVARIERGVEVFKENPIIGSGMALSMKEAPHDTYFLLLQQTGILGFICFWIPIIYLTWNLTIKCKRSTRKLEKSIFLALTGTILAHMALASVVYIIHWRHLWYSIGLSMAALRLGSIENGKIRNEDMNNYSEKILSAETSGKEKKGS